MSTLSVPSSRGPLASVNKSEEVGLVAKEMIDLNRNLNILVELIDKLEEKVNPVLRPSSPIESDKTAPVPMIVPLANELRVQNDRLVLMREQLIEIRDRVEL